MIRFHLRAAAMNFVMVLYVHRERCAIINDEVQMTYKLSQDVCIHVTCYYMTYVYRDTCDMLLHDICIQEYM